MTEFVKVLEVAIEEQDKVKVMTVLDEILEHATAEGDGDLVQRTLETIYIMKEEEVEMENKMNKEEKTMNLQEEEMEIMEKEIKATEEEEEVARELNRLQEEREKWAEELLENPFSDNNIKKRRESRNKLVMDSKSKVYQERLESKEKQIKEPKKSRVARPDNSPHLNSWERANRHLENTRQQKHVLLNRGWL